jgi:hypothetical protein
VRGGQVRQRDVDQPRDPVAIELEVDRGRNVAVFARADLLGGLLGPANIDGPELAVADLDGEPRGRLAGALREAEEGGVVVVEEEIGAVLLSWTSARTRRADSSSKRRRPL